MCDNSQLRCRNFYNESQWGVCDFLMLQIGDFFGINTDLRIDSIPYPDTDICGVQGLSLVDTSIIAHIHSLLILQFLCQ